MVLVGIDAHVGGDGQRFLDDFCRRQVGVVEQGARCALGVRAAAADGDQAMFRFQHIAVAGDDQRAFLVGHRQHRFQPAQDAVGAPVLGQFHGGAQQMALVLFQLGFETLEQGEGVRRAAGESGQNLVVVDAAHLARVGLDHDIAEGDLAVAAEGDLIAAPHREDGGAAKLFHDFSPQNDPIILGRCITGWRSEEQRGSADFSFQDIGELVDAHDSEQGADHFIGIANPQFLAATVQLHQYTNEISDAHEVHPRHIGHVEVNLAARGGKIFQLLQLLGTISRNHAAHEKCILVMRQFIRSIDHYHLNRLPALGHGLPGRRRHFESDGVLHRQILEFSLHSLALVEVEQQLPVGLLILATLPEHALEQIRYVRNADRGDLLSALFQTLQGFHQAATTRGVQPLQPGKVQPQAGTLLRNLLQVQEQGILVAAAKCR